MEPLRSWRIRCAERIVVDPMPSRIVGDDLGQPRGDRWIRYRQLEPRAVRPYTSSRLNARFTGPRPDFAQVGRQLRIVLLSIGPRILRNQGFGSVWMCDGEIEGNAAAHGQAEDELSLNIKV